MSTIKVDTVRPVTADASLTLQGDNSGTGVSGITIDSSGNIALGGVLKLKSSGNSITASDGTTGVLSESGGVVTLAHDLVTGNSSYGFAQLSITSTRSVGNIVWDTISGDTTNITKPNADHDIRLGLAGIYSISVSASLVISGEERAVGIKILNASDDSVYAESNDSIKQADSGSTYGNAVANYVGYFPANSDIYFTTTSVTGGNADMQSVTHASIILIRRTA